MLSCFLNSWKTFQKTRNLMMCLGILSTSTFFLFTAKDKLFNDVLLKLNFQFPKSHVYMNTDIDIVVSFLSYLDSSGEKIMECSRNNFALKPIPKMWHFFIDFQSMSHFVFNCITSFILHVAFCLMKKKVYNKHNQ